MWIGGYEISCLFCKPGVKIKRVIAIPHFLSKLLITAACTQAIFFLFFFFFLKLGCLLRKRYNSSQKFCQNRCISQGFPDLRNFFFLQFLQKNSKRPPILVTQNFFENSDGYFAEIPCRSKISRNQFISHGF